MCYIKKIGIYVIKNLVSGLCYVGQSINIDARIKSHIRDLKRGAHPNSHLQNAWNKYGRDSFDFLIVELCDVSLLDDREMFYINEFDSFNNGYNMTAGGGGALGRVALDSAREKMRNSRKRYTSLFSGANSPVAIPVVLLNTGERFGCISNAAKKYNVAPYRVAECCRHNALSSGEIDGERLVWRFPEEYSSMSANDIFYAIDVANNPTKYIRSGQISGPKTHSVVLLNNGNIFSSIVEACEQMNVDRNCIKDCCVGRQSFGGCLNGEKLVWSYLEDYHKMSKEDIYNKLCKANPPDKMVLLTNTGEVFWSVSHAASVYGLNPHAIRNCCNRRSHSSGKINETVLVWRWHKESA